MEFALFQVKGTRNDLAKNHRTMDVTLAPREKKRRHLRQQDIESLTPESTTGGNRETSEDKRKSVRVSVIEWGSEEEESLCVHSCSSCCLRERCDAVCARRHVEEAGGNDSLRATRSSRGGGEVD